MNDVFERSVSQYKNLSERFILDKKDYSCQFSNIYSSRIAEARHLIGQQAFKKWGKHPKTLMSLTTDSEEKCVIIGTIYKRQELKPSILKEVSKQYQTVPPPPRTHFVSDTDELILEDETQRVNLSGKLNVNKFVTGVVIAVYGTVSSNGVFTVNDYCFPDLELVSQSLSIISDDRYVILISGIDLATCGSLFPVQLFIDWVTGWTGTADQQGNQAKITNVIIAGNCLRSLPQAKPKYGKVTDNSADEEAIKELDDIVKQLAECVNVDVMPGEYDATNHTLPQQPLHKCLFPKAHQYSTFRSVPNPHMFEIEGRVMVGSAGQSVTDIQRYCTIDDSLEVLETTLEWGHLAPTAPDTLPCYPYKDKDPFIMRNRPHVYFAGNQPKFQTKLKEYDSGYNVRLICIPSFVKTHSCVVINLKNLDCNTISFDIMHHQN